MTSPTATSHDNTTPTSTIELSKYHITFLHLDLGIGGAEQLVLQLAHASVACGAAQVALWTTRCDPDHCFASVRPPDGALYSALHVCGTWMPAEILGKGRALCSTLRLWYLALCWIYRHGSDPHQIIVLDVLPSPLPLLQWATHAHILFYCHFPDQLLTRSATTNASRKLYRQWLNWMENVTMPFADTITVNSQFTRQVVQETFTNLKNIDLPVLYPALDTNSLDASAAETNPPTPNQRRTIVSLNRYERKKNLELLLQAAQWIVSNHPQVKLPPIIIAGGYDTKNVENVEYRGELGQIVQQYKLQDIVTFQQSIADDQRQHLLRTALCVVYTPSHEHFGIVPLEAMYCQTPVLAVNSGGPTESIIDGQTGYLRPPTAQAFGQALLTWIQDPDLAKTMGQAGKVHVQERFGFEPRLVNEWRALLQQTIARGSQRQQKSGYRIGHAVVYIIETLVVLVICLALTLLLRQVQILQPNESLLGGIKRSFRQEEL